MALCVDVKATDVEGQRYDPLLYKGLEHLWILISAESPGTNPLKILRDDCTSVSSVQFSS